MTRTRRATTMSFAWGFAPTEAWGIRRRAAAVAMSNPPGNVRADPLTTILGTAEWLSRPRPGAKDGAGPSTSSPTEREARQARDRQLEQHGGVWLGLLRVSDEPWRPRVRRDALRQEELPVEGNSSREGSLSDDGSGATDGNPEVTTFDENTSNASGGGFSPTDTAAAQPAASDSGAAGGDGGSVVGDEPEGSVEVDVPRRIRRRSSRAGGGPGSRKGSFSGADTARGVSAGRAGAARADAGPALVCSLFARPPPGNAGIPGTAGGEGQARAAAAGAPPPRPNPATSKSNPRVSLHRHQDCAEYHATPRPVQSSSSILTPAFRSPTPFFSSSSPQAARCPT